MDNEYETTQDFQSQDLKEEGSGSHKAWYWIIGLLFLVLLGWYGATAGWFGSKDSAPVVIEDTFANQNTDQDGPGINVPQENLAPIDRIEIVTLESFPIQKNLVVSGNLPNGCVFLDSIDQRRDGNIFYVSIATRNEGDICTEALVPYEQTIPLEVIGLPAGVYIVNVNGIETQFELDGDNTIDFSAGSDK